MGKEFMLYVQRENPRSSCNWTFDQKKSLILEGKRGNENELRIQFSKVEQIPRECTSGVSPNFSVIFRQLPI